MMRFVFLVGVLAAIEGGPVGAEKVAEVKVAINNVVSDVVFHLAAERGFFTEQGLNVTLIAFDSGPKMIAPLGAGQIDVGAGASSAGLYNAVARCIDVKCVEDGGARPCCLDVM